MLIVRFSETTTFFWALGSCELIGAYKMDTLPVTLIVKAPNHAEYQDHTVKCELSWTIRRLKGHLSEVYPCQPVSTPQSYAYTAWVIAGPVI